MNNTPISLSKPEIIELVKISNLKDMELSLEQWELMGRLTGSILSQIRECFIDRQETEAIQVSINSLTPLPSCDVLASHVPFFKHRI